MSYSSVDVSFKVPSRWNRWFTIVILWDCLCVWMICRSFLWMCFPLLYMVFCLLQLPFNSFSTQRFSVVAWFIEAFVLICMFIVTVVAQFHEPRVMKSILNFIFAQEIPFPFRWLVKFNVSLQAKEMAHFF